MKEYTELGGQEEMWRWCHLGCIASEALFSRLSEREWNKKRTAWANCFYFQNLSNLVRKLERCPVRLPAWEAQCLKEKPLFFLQLALSCWKIFFIAWECAGTLHYRQLFPEAWCLLLVGRIHLALYERSWGVFNHNPLSSSISQSAGFLWTVCWTWVLWSKCMCVPDRLRGGGLHLNLLPCELGNRVGKHACWKVLLMCFLVI